VVRVVLDDKLLEEVLAGTESELLLVCQSSLLHVKERQVDRLSRDLVRDHVLVVLAAAFHVLPVCEVIDSRNFVPEY